MDNHTAANGSYSVEFGGGYKKRRFWVEPINGVERSANYVQEPGEVGSRIHWTERWVTYGWRLMEGSPAELVAEYRNSDGYSDPEAAARYGMEDARQGRPVQVMKTALIGSEWKRQSRDAIQPISSSAAQSVPADPYEYRLSNPKALRALIAQVGAVIITQQEHENGEVTDEEMSSTVEAMEEALATYELAQDELAADRDTSERVSDFI